MLKALRGIRGWSARDWILAALIVAVLGVGAWFALLWLVWSDF